MSPLQDVHTASGTLPDWRFVEQYVPACGGNVQDWRPRWEQAREELANHTPKAPKSPEPVVDDAAALVVVPQVAAAPLAAGPPDPQMIRSYAELVDMLQQLRIWAGNPSLRDLERRSPLLRRSTVSDLLNGKRQPRLEVVRAFVGACDLDERACNRWAIAWRQATRAQAGIPPIPPRVPPAKMASSSGLPRNIWDQWFDLHRSERTTVAKEPKPRALDRAADQGPIGPVRVAITAVVLFLIIASGLVCLVAWLILNT